MGKLFKRSDSPYWWYDFQASNGKRVRESTQTKDKTLAQEILIEKERQAIKEKKLDAKPIRFWEEAVLMYFKKTRLKDHTRDNMESLFRELDPYLRGKPLHLISKQFIESVVEQKEAQYLAKKNKSLSSATINNYLNKIKVILRKAKNEWEWIDNIPYIKLRKEGPRRERWETAEKLGQLKDKLPRHQYLAMLFALATGLRKTNVSLHEKAWVDLEHKVSTIPGDKYKNGEAHTVVLNTVALSVIKQVWNDHEKFLFTYEPAPISKPGYRVPIKELNTRAWRNALKECGIEDFRKHDLRHTWASWMAQMGASLFEIMEAGGWKDLRSVKRYSHLTKDHLRKVSDQLAHKQLSHLLDKNEEDKNVTNS